MIFLRRLRSLSALFVLSLASAMLHAQAYTSIVVFGDSLSDTGNFTQLSENAYLLQIPGPLANYTVGRFTDGPDTAPAARLYKGVWIEQLAASLPARPTIKPSLNGGLDFAYGDASSGTGTSPVSYGPLNAFTVTVENTGQQVAGYLATHPTIDDKTLFVVWSGANDILAAASLTDPAAAKAAILAAANQNVANVQKLIAAGATEFVVPNLPALGEVPKLNGNKADASAATAAAIDYNAALAAGLASLPAANPGKTLHLFALDAFSLFNSVLAAPSIFGFADVVDSAQLQPVDPDTYLFWDDLHPTTAGHHRLALGAQNLLTATSASSTVLTLGSATVGTGQNIEMIAKVTGSGPTPSGIVTFYEGTTSVAASSLDAGGSGSASFPAGPLSGSPYQITAHYAGDAVYTPSISAAVAETIIPPSYTFTLSPTTLSFPSNFYGTTRLTITPAGGLTGMYKVACGSLPAHVSCIFSTASFTFTGADTPQTADLTIDTGAVAALDLPARPGDASELKPLAAFAFVGGLALVGLKRRRSLALLMMTLVASGALLGLSGCVVNPTNFAAPGSYKIPVTLSPVTSGNSTTVTITLNVQ